MTTQFFEIEVYEFFTKELTITKQFVDLSTIDFIIESPARKGVDIQFPFAASWATDRRLTISSPLSIEEIYDKSEDTSGRLGTFILFPSILITTLDIRYLKCIIRRNSIRMFQAINPGVLEKVLTLDIKDNLSEHIKRIKKGTYILIESNRVYIPLYLDQSLEETANQILDLSEHS